MDVPLLSAYYKQVILRLHAWQMTISYKTPFLCKTCPKQTILGRPFISIFLVRVDNTKVDTERVFLLQPHNAVAGQYGLVVFKVAPQSLHSLSRHKKEELELRSASGTSLQGEIQGKEHLQTTGTINGSYVSRQSWSSLGRSKEMSVYALLKSKQQPPARFPFEGSSSTSFLPLLPIRNSIISCMHKALSTAFEKSESYKNFCR